jgi:integrase
LGLEGGFHLLRKTCACLLLEQGVKIENISRVLGHKDITTTYKFYVEIYDEDQIRSVQALNGLFDPINGDKAALEEMRKRRTMAA